MDTLVNAICNTFEEGKRNRVLAGSLLLSKPVLVPGDDSSQNAN